LFFCQNTNLNTYKQGELGQYPIDTNLEVGFVCAITSVLASCDFTNYRLKKKRILLKLHFLFFC